MTMSKLLSDALWKNTRFGGGVIQPPITLSLKKSTRTSDNKSWDIESCGPEIWYCPESCGAGGAAILGDIISGPSNYVEQNSYLKVLLDVFGEIVGAGGG